MIQFMAGSDTDTTVTLYPATRTQRDIRTAAPPFDIIPLRLRLIKYEMAGTWFCLGATLVDPQQHYSLQDFMDVYHARWGVEELYKVSKRLFMIEDFHAKTERGVKQEVFAHFVLITMNRLFANRANRVLNPEDASSKPRTPGSSIPGAITGGRRTLKSNCKHCLHVFARNLEDLLFLHGRLQTAIHRAFESIVGQYQKVRPGRSYPRTSMKPESKWRPLTKKEKHPKKPTAPMVPA